MGPGMLLGDGVLVKGPSVIERMSLKMTVGLVFFFFFELGLTR